MGEPPGELIISATAGLFLSEKSLSINRDIFSKVMPERRPPLIPITPVNLNVGIVNDDPNIALNIVTNIKSYTKEKHFSKIKIENLSRSTNCL